MRLLPILLLLCLVQSCTPTEFDSVEEYQEWVFSDESGLVQRSSSGNFLFELIYIPESILPDSDSTFNRFAFQMKISDKEGKAILKNGINSKDKYESRINQLEYKTTKYFSFLGKDSISPAFVHYENYRGIRNDILIHAHFIINQKLGDQIEITFNDQIFLTGIHKFIYDAQALKDLPILNPSKT